MKTITSSPHTSRPEPPSLRLRDSPCQDWRALCCSVCPPAPSHGKTPPPPAPWRGSWVLCLPLAVWPDVLRTTGRFSQCCLGSEGNGRWGLLNDRLRSWISGQLLQGYSSQLPTHSLSVGGWVLPAYPSAALDAVAPWEPRPSLVNVGLGQDPYPTECSDLCSIQVLCYTLQWWAACGQPYFHLHP